MGPVPPTASCLDQQEEQVSAWSESCPWWRGDAGQPVGGLWAAGGREKGRGWSITHPLPGVRKGTLEAKCHATWARPPQLGSQSAGEELRREDERRTSPCSLRFLGIWRHLVVSVGRPAGSSTGGTWEGGPCRGLTLIPRRTITLTYLRSRISTKCSPFIMALPSSAAATPPFSRPSLSRQWLLPVGFLSVNQRVL